MSDDLVEIARGSHNGDTYTDGTMKEPRLLIHVLADEIARLRAACDAYFKTISLSEMRHGRILVGLERRNARQRRALAKLYKRRHDKNAALVSARREGMEEAAKIASGRRALANQAQALREGAHDKKGAAEAAIEAHEAAEIAAAILAAAKEGK